MGTVALALVVGLLIAMAPAQEPQQTPAAGQPAEETVTVKKPPQPKTQEEYEAAQKLTNVSLSPDRMIALAEEFVQNFPDSELRGFAYRRAMEGYGEKNDFPRMQEFGEKALALDPENAAVLLLLALAMPERTRQTDLDREEKLNTAEEYAKRALSAIDKSQKPNPQMSDAEWDQMRNDARAQSYAALGYVALKRSQYSAAEEYLKKSIELQVQKDPVVYWRLGLTYEMMKKYELARDTLKQAVELGGVRVGQRDSAAEELQRVETLLKKQQ